jgi:hypothetical protein
MQTRPQLLKHLLSICVFLLCANSQALVNGSFESGLAGWTHTAGVALNPFTPTIPATDGTNSVYLGLDNKAGATLSQAFSAVAGSSNVLSFDFFVSCLPGNFGAMRVTLTTTQGTLFTQSYTNFGPNFPPFNIESKSIPFVVPAGVSNVTLTFMDVSPNSGIACDPVLDNVRVASSASTNLACVIAGPVTNLANGHIYYLLCSNTWTAAQEAAIGLGGNLVTINNAAEQNWVYTNFSSFGGVSRALWIGLSDRLQEGNFVWSSGETSAYSNWSSGEPNSFSASEDYVHIFAPNDFMGRAGKWNDYSNLSAVYPEEPIHTVPLNGVVEIAPSSTPTNPPTPPLIISQPQSATVPVGTNVTFTVGVQNTPPALPTVSSGNLRLWLKSDTGVVVGSSNRVTQWQDQSGLANNCSQANVNKQPLMVAAGLNGRPALRFDGIQNADFGDFLQGTGNLGLTAGLSSFVVYSKADRTVDEEVLALVGVPLASRAALSIYIRSIAGVNNEMAFGVWGSDYGSGFHISPAVPRIWTERLNANKTQIEFFDTDGINNFTTARATSGLLPPGSGYFVGGLGSQTRNFQGNIAELIYYQGALSDGDRVAVENYLRQKYLSPAGGNLLAFQWRFNGTNISGATNSSLTLNNVRLANAGNYSVVVSNLFASVTSSNALLTVIQPNRAPVAFSQSASTNEDSLLPLALIATDADGDPLNYIVSAPAHGTLSGTAPNLIYAPTANFHGSDSFTFKVNDGEFESAVATVSITILPVNDAPVAIASASPAYIFSTNDGFTVVIASCEGTAKVVLDGSKSFDIEDDLLQFSWLEGTNLLAVGEIVTNSFSSGTHIITLAVSDASETGFANLALEIITPDQAVAELIAVVNDSNLIARNKQPLLASLTAAAASFGRCHIVPAINQLLAFQTKVQIQIVPVNPALAEQLLQISSEIIDSTSIEEIKPSKEVAEPSKSRIK